MMQWLKDCAQDTCFGKDVDNIFLWEKQWHRRNNEIYDFDVKTYVIYPENSDTKFLIKTYVMAVECPIMPYFIVENSLSK